MANGFAFHFRVNDQELQLRLKRFLARIGPAPLLRVAGEVMRGSIKRTFREQGSPAGSWPPLAASTLKRGRGGAGRKMLIQSGRLKNSVTYTVSGNTLTIGTNLTYAAIQQLGGEAGRKPPFKKKGGKRAQIPARPYLVFRPEDPERIQAAMERVIDAAADAEGLK